MKVAVAPPFRTADPGRVKCGPWMGPLEPEPVPLAEAITGLDYTSVLSIQRAVEIDIAGLLADCYLPSDAQLTLSASWMAGGTHLKRSLASIKLPVANAPVTLILGGNVPADAASGLLTLETKIALSVLMQNGNPLAARLPGSVVWIDAQSVSLDGATSFFPVQVADFGQAAWSRPDAGWCLLGSPMDMQKPFLGSVKLLINSRHVRIAQAVTGPASSRESQAIRSAIYFDVARSLILGALGDDEFIERDGDYPPESCGKVVNDLIRTMFPHDSLPGLRNAATATPEQFGADLQAALRVFGGVV